MVIYLGWLQRRAKIDNIQHLYEFWRTNHIGKHSPLQMALSPPGTMVLRPLGRKHEDPCGLRMWAQDGLGATGSNTDGTTGKAEGWLPGAGGKGDGKRMKFHCGHTEFETPARSKCKS